MTVPDVHIKVYNDTDEFQNIVIFQQEDELYKMFDKLFPVAWRVFPLPARESQVQRSGTAVYPSAQQIGVTTPNLESFLNDLKFKGILDSVIEEQENMKNQSFLKKTILENLKSTIKNKEQYSNFKSFSLTIQREAQNGEKFCYNLDGRGGQYINKLDGKNDNGSISCQNKSPSLVPIDLYKDNSKLVTWIDVNNEDYATFKLERKIGFMFDPNLKIGDIISREKIEDKNRVEVVDLTGYSHIEVKLTYDPNIGGEKKNGT
ncbi:MAG: hypothetical protein WBB43_18105 [Limnoraphis sp.]